MLITLMSNTFQFQEKKDEPIIYRRTVSLKPLPIKLKPQKFLLPPKVERYPHLLRSRQLKKKIEESFLDSLNIMYDNEIKDILNEIQNWND